MLTLNVKASWTDTNAKVFHCVGTLTPSLDYPRGGDGADFSGQIPAGYNTAIHFDVEGFAPSLGVAGGSAQNFTARPVLNNVNIPGIGNRVVFFDNTIGTEFGGTTLQTPYNADILGMTLQFYAMFKKP